VTASQRRAPAPTHSDVSYADISPRNVCDIYRPDSAGPSGTCPVVIWIHGGAFRIGDKRDLKMACPLINAGLAIVSINYRLSQHAIWPAQLEDLANVSRFIRTNAAEYGFDTARLAAFGSSAGGHLAAMMGIALADDPGLRIHAVVDWYGPIHFEHMDHDIGLTGVERGSPPNGEAGSPESDLIGAVVNDRPDLAYAASPLHYLEKSSSAPPFLIMHGDRDPLIAHPQSERLRDALQEKFGSRAAEYCLLPDTGHGGGAFESDRVKDLVVGFLKRTLG
jgi:acetyl esterase/lipase